jgi:thiol-disulfide isomerase/thioredoxin
MKRNIILILVLTSILSCKEEKQNHLVSQKEKMEFKKKDSLSISIDMPAKSSTGLNTWLKPYDEFFLEFKNKSEKDSTITKKLPFINDIYVTSFFAYKYDENKKLKKIERHFIATQDSPNIELKLGLYGPEYKNKTEQNIITDRIYNNYAKLSAKFFKNKKLATSIRKKKLDSLKTFFDRATTNQKVNSLINEMLYLDEIQKINSTSKELTEFIEKSKEIIVGGAQTRLLFNYYKNNATSLNYKVLNTKNYSDAYIELLAIGAYRFLKFEDYKGDARYNNTVEWLKTTDFYKRDATYIRKKITPIDSKKFRNYLSKIKLLDIHDNEVTIARILKENSSQYYLIDFWATWCAPCIQGVKLMEGMKIPENVKVLSFSVDSEKDKGKWSIKTKELKQKFTFWFNERNEENKGFTEFIEMHSIPRYVLIDKNMNLIDQAFYHPQESQFLSKLKDIKNHKYW